MVAAVSRRHQVASRHPEAGYNLVALMVIVAVVNIAIAASLPVWSNIVKRDKESELIFRGLQYAEAIRVFQKRTGRYPNRLEELIDIEPRSIRQLWLDPMSKEPEWGLVLAQGGQGAGAGRQIGGGSGLREDGDDRRRRRRRRRRERESRNRAEETISPRQRIASRGGGSRGVPRAGEQVTVGPIIGVHSLSDEKALRTFAGASTYNDWKFTTELLPQISIENIGENVPRLHSNWVGRAFPEGAEGALDGGLPNNPLDEDDDR